MPILFGTFNRSTATSAELELSQSLQTAFANFVKNPNSSPAPDWPPYEPEGSEETCPTLAKIAYEGNVDYGNFIQLVQPNSTVSHWTRIMQNLVCLFMKIFSCINRMDRAVYGTNFWISAPESSRPLHKIIVKMTRGAAERYSGETSEVRVAYANGGEGGHNSNSTVNWTGLDC